MKKKRSRVLIAGKEQLDETNILKKGIRGTKPKLK
jgi:hypothetical protein